MDTLRLFRPNPTHAKPTPQTHGKVNRYKHVRMDEFEALMSKLTPREQQICKVIQQQPSLNYTGIGQRVGISKHTVNFHLKSVYNKLSVDGKTALAVKLSKGGDGNG